MDTKQIDEGGNKQTSSKKQDSVLESQVMMRVTHRQIDIADAWSR